MLDLLLDYKQEHEYHLSNFTKVVFREGDDFVKINNDQVDIAAIKNMISIINSLNH
jgi:type II secretory pathway component PulC